MRTIELKVEGMSCGLCARTIERALAEIGCNGRADLDKAVVSVEYDDTCMTLEKIKEVVSVYGYKVTG